MPAAIEQPAVKQMNVLLVNGGVSMANPTKAQGRAEKVPAALIRIITQPIGITREYVEMKRLGLQPFEDDGRDRREPRRAPSSPV